LNEASHEAAGLVARASHPERTGLRGVRPAGPGHVCDRDTFPSDAVLGVADGQQVGRRGQRALRRILDAERFRDRRFAASLAEVTAPVRDVICYRKPRRHVGGS
jgi:hypothetical protein